MESFGGVVYPAENSTLVPQFNLAGPEGLTGLIPSNSIGFKVSGISEDVEQLLTHNLDRTEIPSTPKSAWALPSQDFDRLPPALDSLKPSTTIDSLTGQSMDRAGLIGLNQLAQAAHVLTEFATDEDFTANAAIAFGSSFNTETLENLRQDWLNGNFEALPSIEIRSTGELEGANGAFSRDTNTIYLSQEYIIQNAFNPQAITDVLLEEIGHYIDSRINSSDSAGDEGAIFSALVQDVQLNASELQALKVEDDTTTIALSGQVIQIEQASEIKIDFQPDTSTVPVGYKKDTGQAFNNTRGYGWVRQDSLSNATHTPLDITLNSRDRNQTGINRQLNTLLHMQYPTQMSNGAAVKTPAAWEYALSNGQYKVTVGVGDSLYYDSQHTINVEGKNAISGFQGSPGNKFRQTTLQTSVNDGKLTIDAIGGTNTKLNYIKISPIASSTDNGKSGAIVGASINNTNYSIPSGAYFISPGGSNDNPGTQTAPWGSIQKAIKSAPSGSTIVLRGGTYYEGGLNVDKTLTFQPYPNEEVWLDGSDTQKRGLVLRNESSNSVVRGLGFKNYTKEGVRMNSPASNVKFENNIFTENTESGLVLAGTGAIVRGNTLSYNGQVGLTGNYADGTLVEDNLFDYNNLDEKGNKGAIAGTKFTRSDSVTIQDNIAENNNGSGIWLDLSCTDATIVRNITRSNSDDGIFFEISHEAIIASNLSYDNGDAGIKVHNSTNTQVFNNTLAKNAVNLSIGDTPRANPDWAEYVAGNTWETANVVVKNNLFSNTEGEVPGWGPMLLNVYSDVNIPGRTIVSEMSNNGYHRTFASYPETAVRYKPTPAAQAVRFKSVTDFSSNTGLEQSSAIAVDNAAGNPFFMNEANGDYRLKPGSPADGSGTPLPWQVADAIGVPTGVYVDRGALKLPEKRG